MNFMMKKETDCYPINEGNVCLTSTYRGYVCQIVIPPTYRKKKMRYSIVNYYILNEQCNWKI